MTGNFFLGFELWFCWTFGGHNHKKAITNVNVFFFWLTKHKKMLIYSF